MARKKSDPELQAITKVAAILADFPREQRLRILTYLTERNRAAPESTGQEGKDAGSLLDSLLTA